jgi:group I intron endonuclease
MNNNFYVYQHVDPRTNLIRYIGKGRGKRAWDFSARYGHHKNWLKQLKDAGLEPRVELIETDKTEEQAFELERMWIAACRSSFQPLTNLTDGGEGTSGWVPSEETRQKMSEAHGGEKNHYFGKTLSEEHRKKISEARSGEKHHYFGKTRSEETRQKISEAHSGKTLSEEHRQKMSEAHSGKTHSDETRKKMSQAKIGKASSRRRAVIGVNLTTGEERTFESGTAAASYVNGHICAVSLCCTGKYKQTKGWTFRYAENKP